MGKCYNMPIDPINSMYLVAIASIFLDYPRCYYHLSFTLLPLRQKAPLDGIKQVQARGSKWVTEHAAFADEMMMSLPHVCISITFSIKRNDEI